MQSPVAPLRFPSHFPPTTRWKKFFIGVRWIGPDLSFFRELKAQQAARSPEAMSRWGGGLRQEVAERVAASLKASLRWKTAVFLPEDSFQVICHGPSFDWADEFALEAAVEDLQSRYDFEIPVSLWDGVDSATFGEVVDAIVAHMQAGGHVVPAA